MKLLLFSVQMLILSQLLTACSEEATPYEEINATLSNPQDQGQIQTH